MAVGCLERAMELFGPPLYVYHEIVHNKRVVDGFRRRGVIFVGSLDEVPEGSRLLYSAHGVSPVVRRQAESRRLRTIDATCPLVHKVHLEAARFAREGFSIVLIGHAGHDEVVGTLGTQPEYMQLVETAEDVDLLEMPDSGKVAYLTQTTLSADDAGKIVERLRRRFPKIEGPAKEDICYATQNRQEAVKVLIEQADAVLVLGSRNSSNSNRLAEIARAHGAPAHLIDGSEEIDPAWFFDADTILITAGASAPKEVIDECLSYFVKNFDAVIDERVICKESARFALPRELQVQTPVTLPTLPADVSYIPMSVPN
jgi:4-hydroxy-3-methylbut-2-enyl diphosphate reductase